VRSLHAEFSFLSKYYNVLYQSFMPNCKITVAVVRRYYSISNAVEKYISSGLTTRVRLKRVLNFLLVSLDRDKCYEKFASILNAATVLPQRMIKGELSYKDNSMMSCYISEWVWDLENKSVHRINARGSTTPCKL